MNIEQNEQVYEQPRKSGRGLFACGGIGCLLMLLFCGGGMGLMAYIAVPFASSYQEAMEMAKENEAVVAAVGEPIEFGQPTNQSQNPDTNEVEMEIPITGPNGSANLIMTIKFENFSLQEKGLKVELEDGQIIDLRADDKFELPDVEDGMDE